MRRRLEPVLVGLAHEFCVETKTYTGQLIFNLLRLSANKGQVHFVIERAGQYSRLVTDLKRQQHNAARC